MRLLLHCHCDHTLPFETRLFIGICGMFLIVGIVIMPYYLMYKCKYKNK